MITIKKREKKRVGVRFLKPPLNFPILGISKLFS
jgi:hypothetical protein